MKEGNCWTVFHSEHDFQNGTVLPIQLASVHRLRSPASKVTCYLSKELAQESWFILLKRLSELVGLISRFLRTMAIFLLLQCSSDFSLRSDLFLVCPVDYDLKISWLALLVVYTMFKIFVILQTNLTDMFQQNSS